MVQTRAGTDAAARNQDSHSGRWRGFVRNETVQQSRLNNTRTALVSQIAAEVQQVG